MRNLKNIRNGILIIFSIITTLVTIFILVEPRLLNWCPNALEPCESGTYNNILYYYMFFVGTIVGVLLAEVFKDIDELGVEK